MNEKLSFMPSLTDAYVIGMKNVTSIVVAVILYVLTVWIPYINVGTTIAISNLPVELSKGKVISPLSIFDAKYRNVMGEYFLLQGVMAAGIGIGFVFLVIPAIVISISWSMAVYLLLDKKISWAQCLTESNKMTMGYKWKIFFLQLALAFVIFITLMIGTNIPYIGWLIVLIAVIVGLCAAVSLNAVIYRELQKNDETPAVVE